MFCNKTTKRYSYGSSQGFPDGSVIKKKKTLPAMLELDPLWVGPLEEEMASHSSIFAWEIPWTEEPGGLQSVELQKSQM